MTDAMGDSLKKYPAEPLRERLQALGLPRDQHSYEALKAFFAIHFKGPLNHSLENVNALAEILIYLHQKKVLSLKPGPL